MKQKMKTILKLFAFSTIFILFACSEDFYDNAISKNNLKVSHKKFEDLIKDKNFNKVISEVIKFKNKISSNSKTVMEQKYGFNISDKSVNVIETDSITSYTLFVTRENNPNNIIENLIIQTKNNNPNDIKAFLFKYVSNVDINENFDMSNFQGTKSILPIVYNIKESDTTGKMIYIETCWTVTSWYCYGPGEHCNSTGCTMGFPITSQNCITSGYDDGTGGGGGGGGTSSGGGGSSSGDVFTAPHRGGGVSGTTKTPCQQLKDNNSKPIANTTPPKTVLSNLNDLTSQMATNPSERMYIMTPVTTAENQFVDTPPIEGPLNGGDVEYDLGFNAVSIMMHCHYNTTLLSIFSLSDIQQIYQSTQAANIFSPDTFTSYLVTAHGTKYAIRFAPQDPNSLDTYNENFFTGWEADIIKDAREDLFELSVNTKNTVAQNELGFLKFLKDQKLGIEIYKADATFSQWSKLSIGTNGQVKTTPCP